ncbi:hypothetical protein VNO78_16535 [Psophocarpus tetragonolobus]|uniref:Uncharacterized protein n=1 Tax=Psophocarpus tetragonolobus TaxID=3891 RepID=A0AAN9XKK0_PSOTE
MEAYRKTNRGSMRGKLIPFYRNNAPKPSSSLQYLSSSSSPASVGFVVHDATANRDNKKVIRIADNRSNFNELYGQPGDETVDKKAEIYIAMVQKRLMLERLTA